MTNHPRERPSYDRRRFLRNSLFASLGAVAGPSVLSACGQSSTSDDSQLPLARPNHPVRLPLQGKAIANGLKPESGTLKVFNYAEYIAPGVTKSFGEQYGVDVEVTTFNSMDEAVAKLRAGQSSFDVFFPTPDIVAKIVVGKLLQPLNHSYLPNLGNAWPELQDPFYDRGSRYTVPYNVYSTGIGYRADQVKAVPAKGWDIIWDPQYSGQVHILDDGREAIGMSLLRNGVRDVNTEDPKQLDAAGAQLRRLVPLVHVKVDINGYTEVPEGRALVHQCWSGDMISAQYYLATDETPDVLGYWHPEGSSCVVGNDTIAIPADAEHPVLAHHFLNYLLDEKNALRNFGWVGYQPAIAKFTADYLIGQKYVPANLASAVVTDADLRSGSQLLQLSAEGRAHWDNVWATFKSG